MKTRHFWLCTALAAFAFMPTTPRAQAQETGHEADADSRPGAEERRAAEVRKIEALLRTHLRFGTFHANITKHGVVLTGTAASQRIANRATQLVDALADWEKIRPLVPEIGKSAPDAQSGRPNKNRQAAGVVNLIRVRDDLPHVKIDAEVLLVDQDALGRLQVKWERLAVEPIGDDPPQEPVAAPRLGVGARQTGAQATERANTQTELRTGIDRLKTNGNARSLITRELRSDDGGPMHLVVGGQIPFPPVIVVEGKEVRTHRHEGCIRAKLQKLRNYVA